MFLKALPLLFSALLALPLLANATDPYATDPYRCISGDDPDYSWSFTYNNGRTYLYNCAFLSKPTNPEQQAKRINNWCPQTVDGIKIKNKCRAACNNSCSAGPRYICYPKSSQWVDRFGDACDWYATDRRTRCGPTAERFANKFGKSANWNCCACGGGTKEAQKMVECVDTRQRDNLGWVAKGPGFLSFLEAKTACRGYKYLSIECPGKNGFEVFCLNEFGLQGSRQILDGECMNDLSDTSLNGADNGHCTGPYFELPYRVWLGGWHRGAVYLLDPLNPDEKFVTEDEDEVVGTLESGIIMEKKQAAY